MAGTKRKSSSSNGGGSGNSKRSVPDFKKIKHKVGKKAAKAENHTSTQFKVRSIGVKEQLKNDINISTIEKVQSIVSTTASTQSENANNNTKILPSHLLLTTRHQSIYDLLSACTHHNTNVRIDVIRGIEELCRRYTIHIYPSLNHIHPYISTFIIHEDKRVRDALYDLLACIIPILYHNHQFNTTFLSLYISYINVAICHLIPSIRRQALSYLLIFLNLVADDHQSEPHHTYHHEKPRNELRSALWSYHTQLLPNLQSMLNNKIYNTGHTETTYHESAVNKQQRKNKEQKDVYKHRLLTVECIDKYLQLSVSHDEVKHRPGSTESSHATLSTLDHLIEEVMQSRDSTTSNNADSVLTQLTPLDTFASNSIPLLIEYWVECSPHIVKSQVSQLQYNSDKQNALHSQLNIIYYIVHAIHTLLSRCDNRVITRQWNIIEQRIFPYFPFQWYADHMSVVLSAINLQMAYIMSLDMKSGRTISVDGKNPHTADRVIDFIGQCFLQFTQTTPSSDNTDDSAGIVPSSTVNPPNSLPVSEVHHKVKEATKQRQRQKQRNPSSQRIVTQNGMKELLPLLRQLLPLLESNETGKQAMLLHSFHTFFMSLPYNASSKIHCNRFIYQLLQPSNNIHQLPTAPDFLRQWLLSQYHDLMKICQEATTSVSSHAVGTILDIIKLCSTRGHYVETLDGTDGELEAAVCSLFSAATNREPLIRSLPFGQQKAFIHTLYQRRQYSDTLTSAITECVIHSRCERLQSELLQLLHSTEIPLSRYMSLLFRSLAITSTQHKDQSSSVNESESDNGYLYTPQLSKQVAALLTDIDQQHIHDVLEVDHVNAVPPLMLLQSTLTKLLCGQPTMFGNLSASTLLYQTKVLLTDASSYKPLTQLRNILDAEFISSVCNAMASYLAACAPFSTTSNPGHPPPSSLVIDILLTAPFLFNELLRKIISLSGGEESTPLTLLNTLILLVGNVNLRHEIQENREMVVMLCKRLMDGTDGDIESAQLSATLESHLSYALGADWQHESASAAHAS